jgi:hypothetical protein
MRPEDLLGETDYDLFSAEQAEIFRNVDKQALAAGAGMQAEEVVVHEKTVTSRYLSVKAHCGTTRGRCTLYVVFLPISPSASAQSRRLRRSRLVAHPDRGAARLGLYQGQPGQISVVQRR